MLHAGPDAAKIDRVDPIEFFSADIGGFERRRLHAGIIERGVEAPEGRNRALEHGTTSDSSVTLQRMPTALPPAPASLSAADTTASSSMSIRATAAPASANAFAVASPIPEAAPVTSATLSLKENSI